MIPIECEEDPVAELPRTSCASNGFRTAAIVWSRTPGVRFCGRPRLHRTIIVTRSCVTQFATRRSAVQRLLDSRAANIRARARRRIASSAAVSVPDLLSRMDVHRQGSGALC
jgi:hypothetical protein